MDKEIFHNTSVTGRGASDRSETPPLSPDAPKAIFEPDSTGSASEAVVSLVAETEERDPLDLPPLYEAVDPEALDQLCASPSESNIKISFSYCGYTVLIEGSGIVQLLS